MPTVFDIHNMRTRLLLGGFIVTAGAVVTHATRGLEAPGLAAVLTLVLERVFGLSEHVLGHDLHRKFAERSLSPEDLLVNHDLVHAIAQALELACRTIANELNELPPADRKRIVLIGAGAVNNLQGVLDRKRAEFQPIAESEVTTLIQGWARGTHGQAILATDKWAELLTDLATAIQIPVNEQPATRFYRRVIERLRGRPLRAAVSPHSIHNVATALDVHFQLALREVLKYEFENRGKAYASLELAVWGELLSQYQLIFGTARGNRRSKRQPAMPAAPSAGFSKKLA
jgi:hypothetical protein